MRPDEMTLEEQLVASMAVANHRNGKKQEETMAEKIQFDTNVPVTLALKYATGKTFPSQFGDGDQTMFTTTDGRVMFLSGYASGKIDSLGLAPGEPFTMCKREIRNGHGKPRIEWQVELAGPAVSTPAPSGATATRAQRPESGSSSSPQYSRPVPQKLPIDRAMETFLIIAGRAKQKADPSPLVGEGARAQRGRVRGLVTSG